MSSPLMPLLAAQTGKEFEYEGFRFGRATTLQERAAALRLRSEVFLHEGFVEPEGLCDGVFRDAFDDVALHCVAYDGSGELVGTARFVLPSPLGFPTEGLFELEPHGLPFEELGEIGRLAIAAPRRGGKREPMLGLIKLLFDCARENGIRYTYAFMPPKLVEGYEALGCSTRRLAERPPGPATLERRRPMHGYFTRQRIQPVVFLIEEVARSAGLDAADAADPDRE